MKLGIVGLPNVGKSTLFNALTNAGAAAANYPFCTIEPNVGIVEVPDERLDVLTRMYSSEKTVRALIEFVDIAGLVAGASKGEGLGNKFLSHIREVDAVVHVVRCFDNPKITHVSGRINPCDDIEIINLELIYSDIEIVERRLDKAKKQLKGDKSFEKEASLLERTLAHLNDGKSARTMDLTREEEKILDSSPLLSRKKIIYAANIGENEISAINNIEETNPYYAGIKKLADAEGSEILPICASLEAEIMELPSEEKIEFMRDLGIEESGLDKLIRKCYGLLGLISFLTAGPKESRAWTITDGAKAPEAAGKIHTDFERGFIRAEVVAYSDLIKSGNYNAAKENGLIRSEGKEYIVKDGDVILFRFNV